MAPQQQAAARLRAIRTAIWHLRKGGLSQLRDWRQRRRAEPVDFRIRMRSGGTFEGKHVPEWPVPEATNPTFSLRVGIVMDVFSADAWSYEFDTVELKPSNWRDRVDQLQLLFVESAWAGSHGAWKYQLTGSKAPSDELQALVAACRERGIRTVFWNKEDPPHFDDFLTTAKLFDHVFTTDQNKVDDYRLALGHDNVDVLGFGAQPAMHNPIRIAGMHQVRDIGFGGTYFSHKFPERREQMDLLLGAAARVSQRRDIEFDIYSRFQADEKYRFPKPLDEHVRGSLEYRQMLTGYRLHKVMLNVNSVTDSPTMLARRVFEILASGTPVVSAPSPAIDHWFGEGLVQTVTGPDEAEHVMRALVKSPELRDRTVHLAQRHIWQNHTFTHRAEQVMRATDARFSPQRRKTVTAVAPTIRPHLVEGIIQTIARQRDVDVQLKLLTHGFDADLGRVRALAAEAGLDIEVLHATRHSSLGENLNRLIAAADGEVIAKIDDDDFYGDHYLSDALFALDYSDAQIVGKQARYVRLEASGATALAHEEREHRFTDFVAGPTLVGPREVFEQVPFEARTIGEDTALLHGVTDVGGRIYSADRFNFVQLRHGEGHTWQQSDAEMLANSRVVAYATLTEHVNV